MNIEIRIGNILCTKYFKSTWHNNLAMVFTYLWNYTINYKFQHDLIGRAKCIPAIISVWLNVNIYLTNEKALASQN